MKTLEQYLEEFAKVADDWYAERPFLREYHEFFREFFKPESLRRAEWSDIQKLGDHLHCFTSMKLAKGKAFGRPNYPIEAYRESLLFIAHGEGTVEDRIREFQKNPKHTNKYLGESAMSEIFGQLNADRYVFRNARDVKAAQLLGITTKHAIGDNAGNFERFNKAIRPVFEKYKEIVGPRTDLPLGLEVDQFFSWLYETYIVTVKPPPRTQQVWLLAAGRKGEHWDLFLEQGIAGIGFFALSDVGQVTKYKSLEDLKVGVATHLPGKEKRTNDIRAIWEFVHDMKKGDLIIAKQGRKTVLGYGKVQGDYKFVESNKPYEHVRKVEWKKTGTCQIPEGKKGMGVKTLTNMTRFPNRVATLKELLGIGGVVPVERNYWWLNSNPSIWSVSEFKVGQRQYYTTHNEHGNKRVKYEHFHALQPGDEVIGYETSPVRRVTSVLRVTKGIYQRSGEECVEFEVVRHLDEELRPHWDTLQAHEELQECEPIKSNQGSLFALTEEEYQIIVGLAAGEEPISEDEPYTLEDALDNLYMPGDLFESMLNRLQSKHNVILQGPPGVGKTFVVKRLAHALMEVKDPSRLKMVQFHQSYSYEDFIQGYRPNPDGGCTLKNGVFYCFCKKAGEDSSNTYVFIIDEINRGNLSKILGELMMLIESDKRGPEYAMQLAYQEPDAEPFYVPRNLYVIGMMNTADRSLAMVDYALRRRFSFIDIKPAFGRPKFTAYLEEACIPGVDKHIIERFTELNVRIAAETSSLGPGFCVGHSYFCLDKTQWPIDENTYNQIIETEIAPLLREYWFDRPKEADDEIKKLRLAPVT